MSNLRIAQVTIPTEDNDGQSLAVIHMGLKRELCLSFGGYTSFETGGGWIDPADGKLYEEDGTTYQVALDPAEAGMFISLVRQAGRMAGQKAVFYVIDGVAHIDTLEEPAPACWSLIDIPDDIRRGAPEGYEAVRLDFLGGIYLPKAVRGSPEVAEAASFAAARLNVPMPASPLPRLRTLSGLEMEDYLGHAGFGVYLNHKQEICLLTPEDAARLAVDQTENYGRLGVLAHEATHWLQYAIHNNDPRQFIRTYDDAVNMEIEAFTVQMDWYREHGEPVRFADTDAIRNYLLSSPGYAVQFERMINWVRGLQP